MSVTGEFKICPFCKEQIRAEAAKCSFCAEMLPESTKVSPIAEEKAEQAEIPKGKQSPQPTSVVKSLRINMTVVAVLGLLALTALGGFYIWSSHNRFYIMSGSQGVAYEIDRRTGETWVLRGGNKTRHKWPEPRAKAVEELPAFESAKITGNAGLGSGLFSGKIYNGTRWTVAKIIVTVTAKEENGSTRWTRDFAHDIQIQPLTTASLYIEVTGDQGIREASWAIKSVWGYKE
jgi:hypothetical protein